MGQRCLRRSVCSKAYQCYVTSSPLSSSSSSVDSPESDKSADSPVSFKSVESPVPVKSVDPLASRINMSYFMRL